MGGTPGGVELGCPTDFSHRTRCLRNAPVITAARDLAGSGKLPETDRCPREVVQVQPGTNDDSYHQVGVRVRDQMPEVTHGASLCRAGSVVAWHPDNKHLPRPAGWPGPRPDPAQNSWFNSLSRLMLQIGSQYEAAVAILDSVGQILDSRQEPGAGAGMSACGTGSMHRDSRRYRTALL